MSISNATHTLDILEEKNGIAFCEITKNDAEKQSEYRFYVVRVEKCVI